MVCQCRFIDYSKCATRKEDIDKEGSHGCVGESSVPSSQFGYEPKTALKKESLKKKWSHNVGFFKRRVKWGLLHLSSDVSNKKSFFSNNDWKFFLSRCWRWDTIKTTVVSRTLKIKLFDLAIIRRPILVEYSIVLKTMIFTKLRRLWSKSVLGNCTQFKLQYFPKWNI